MLSNQFFKELKQYNPTSFRTLQKADLSSPEPDPITNKAFSSVITRFFIFCEKHKEISDSDLRLLFFKLKIDTIAQYFSEYPESNIDYLKGFQLELKNYVDKTRKGVLDEPA